MLSNIQGLVEYVMYIYQEDMPIYGGGGKKGGASVPGAWYKLVVELPEGGLIYPH